MLLTPLKLARLKKGLRQIDIAIRLGTSTATISHLEQGLINPSSDLKRKIADMLECQADEIFPEKAET